MTNKPQIKNNISVIRLLVVIVLAFASCLVFSGCGHRLSGRYISESGYYEVKFSSDGSCTWYQSGSYFNGTYYWDSDDNCYYLEMRGNGLYINTTFKAKPVSDGLVISGGTVNHEIFTKTGGSSSGSATAFVLFFIFFNMMIGAGIVVLVIMLTRRKRRLSAANTSIHQNQSSSYYQPIDLYSSTRQNSSIDYQPQYCPNCGVPLGPDQNFCNKCGRRLK